MAKPLLECLWADGDCAFDLDECRSVALWAAMTCMVLQALGDEQNWLFSDFDRTLMWKNHKIRPFVGVWVAHCVGRRGSITEARASRQVPQAMRKVRGVETQLL